MPVLVHVDVNQNGIYIWGSHYSVAEHMHREEKITASGENGPVVPPWAARVACNPISVITCHVRHNYILRPGLLPHLHVGLRANIDSTTNVIVTTDKDTSSLSSFISLISVARRRVLSLCVTDRILRLTFVIVIDIIWHSSE